MNNNFGSTFEDEMLGDLIGGNDPNVELRIVSIMDRHAHTTNHGLENLSPRLQIVTAHYDDDIKIFLQDADIVLVECRILGGFRDLKLISSIRNLRPMVPIIAMSENLDQEFMEAAYETGVTDYVSTDTSSSLLLAKMRSIHRLSSPAKHLETKNQEVIDVMHSLRDSKEKLKVAISSRINAETQKEFAEEIVLILKRNKEILDSLSEAFFVIKKDLSIDTATSASCNVLFGKEIAGTILGQALGIKDEQEKLIAMILRQLFENTMPHAVSRAMLPTQVTSENGLILSFTYNVIIDKDGHADRVIIVAQDVTEAVVQKIQFQRQTDQVNSLFSILQNMESFQEFLSDFKNDIEQLRSSKIKQNLLRILHTIKGNAGFYSLEFLQKRIHAFETMIAERQASEKSFFSFMQKVATDLEEQMRRFMQRNRKILKLDYDDIRNEFFTVRSEQIDQFLQILADLEGRGRDQLVAEVEGLRRRPLTVLTVPMLNLVQRLGKKLEKQIDFEVLGSSLRTDIEYLSPLFRSLVHLLSNACDHGIETPEERLRLGKPATGKLNFSIEATPDLGMTISIEDDGIGLDPERLRETALKAELLSPEELAKLSTSQTYQLIFHDGFSTAEELTQTSGRGIGMSAVKAEVEKLGGQIEIESSAGQGTRFIITVPKIFPQLGRLAVA